jgi:hypothetical protein
MFSYLEVVQKVVDSSSYSRGIKLYLEGKVSKPKELLLDFWREYEVLGHENYIVRVPVLHFALTKNKWDRAGEVLQQFSHCQCAFFEEYGVCKHIVGVCASLEHEFGEKPETVEAKKEVGSILDRVFEVEVGKRARVWEDKLENYFSKSYSGALNWVDEIVLKVEKEPDIYTEFLGFLKSKAQDATRDYMKEKRLVRLIQESLVLGGMVWWNLWEPFILNFESQYQVDLATDLWRMQQAGIAKAYEPQLKNFLQNLTAEQKDEVLQRLQTTFVHNQSIWINFVITSKYTQWLEQHLDRLDPLTLIQVCLLMPEQREEVEVKILTQLKLWGDFLQTGDYNQVIEVFHTWRDLLGRSEFYEQALKYFKEHHGKKKKLIGEIEE